MTTKLLRATITINVEAADFQEAAQHERCIQACVTRIKDDYPDAELSLTERRRPLETPAAPRRFHPRSGQLKAYE